VCKLFYVQHRPISNLVIIECHGTFLPAVPRAQRRMSNRQEVYRHDGKDMVACRTEEWVDGLTVDSQYLEPEAEKVLYKKKGIAQRKRI